MIEVFHSSPNKTNKTKVVREPRGNLSATSQSNMRKQIQTTNTNPDLTNIDHVPSSGTNSGSNAMLYAFEGNEAVIKMIIKGRSPTMRPVSRTHRVALHWLFDRINVDPEIRIKYVDTREHAAVQQEDTQLQYLIPSQCGAKHKLLWLSVQRKPNGAA